MGLRTCSKEHKTLDILKGHTFITRCIREFCKNQTVAFACPHCLKTIQFYETKEPFRPAFHPDHPPPFKAPEPEPEPQLPTLGDLIPFAQRQTHTMIVGSTGSGKTEAMKQFIHSLLSQNVAGVVIDPHGDMAKEVAHWKNDRLIYLDPSLQKGHSPTINPFEIYGIDAADVSDDALAVKRVISQQLLSALQEITAAGERSEITKNMQTILNACILSLLDLQNATIRDLQRYMDDNRNIELVKFGSSRTHYPDVSEFSATTSKTNSISALPKMLSSPNYRTCSPRAFSPTSPVASLRSISNRHGMSGKSLSAISVRER